ncbi:MAG TPA: hypothetical protein VFA12_02125 [Stellaceae bacterium]|nr:hypothetical protein [Stellaceae bacterium]
MEWRSLYADGFLYFVRVLEHQGFALLEPARRTVHVLQQLPVVAALRLGVTRLETLALIYGLSLQLLPLALTAGCYPLLPRRDKALFLLPLAQYLIGTMAASFAPIVEGPVAAGYFWLLLFLILFGRGRLALAASAVLALPALFLHETTVLLMPVLALVCARRGRGEEGAAARGVYWALALWFLAVAVVQAGYIVNPRSVERRHDVLTTARLLFGVGNLNGINVPAALAVAAVVAGLVACRRGDSRAAWRPVWLFAGLSLALVLATLAGGESTRLFTPGVQFAARNLSVIVSLPLAALLLWSLRAPAGRALWMRPQAAALVVLLGLGQAGWHAVGVHFWSSFAADFRAVLAGHRGYVRWPEVIADMTPRQADRARRLVWSWVNPVASLVLSPGGHVTAIIGPVDERGWRPFDPADPDQLPRAPQFDYAAYVAALAAARR